MRAVRSRSRHPTLSTRYGWLTRLLAGGPVGKVARFAVREYPYVARGDVARITLGPDVDLNNAVLNCSGGDIVIGRGVFCGHNVMLIAATHDYCRFGLERQDAIPQSGHDITIGDGTWLASNVTVIGPCTIGEHCVVAAGAVVTSDLPAYAVAAGVPARVIKLVNQ